MGLDFSQKHLLNTSLHHNKKGREHRQHAMLFPMRQKKHFTQRQLEVYAFWTGFVSTIISLLEVIVIALKK